MGIQLTDGSSELVLVTKNGQAIRFAEEQIRPMGRTAQGVTGIKLEEHDEVVALAVANDEADLLVVTEKGYGKRTPISDYPLQNRAGKGVITLKRNERTGPVVASHVVREGSEVMILSIEGIMIRIKVADISRQGRNTQGVVLMRLDEKDRVVDVADVGMEEDLDE